MTGSGDGIEPLWPLHAELASRMRKGDAAMSSPSRTLEDVYHQYFGFAWRNLRRLGVPRDQLDDAVQELFIVVHRQLPRFEGRSTLKTWIAGIAWRIASEFRRHHARKGNTEPLPEDELAHRGPDPQQAVIQSEALSRLDRLLQQLDDDKRTVFVLTELEQMSAREIAEALGVNMNTVYSRLRAARRAFEEALANERRGER